MKNRDKVLGAAALLGLTLLNERFFHSSRFGKIGIGILCVVLIVLILKNKIGIDRQEEQADLEKPMEE